MGGPVAGRAKAWRRTGMVTHLEESRGVEMSWSRPEVRPLDPTARSSLSVGPELRSPTTMGETPKFLASAWDYRFSREFSSENIVRYLGIGHVITIRVQPLATIWTLCLRQRLGLSLRRRLWLRLGHLGHMRRWIPRRRLLECRMDMWIVPRWRHLHRVEMRRVRRHHVPRWRRPHHIGRRGVVYARRLCGVLRCCGWSGPISSRWRLLKLERGDGAGDLGVDHGDVEALAEQDLLELIELKTGNMAFEKRLALGNLVLNTLSVATRGQRLSVPVLLVAGDAGGGAGSTSGMFGVTLTEEDVNVRQNGNCRRCRPSGLAFIFLLLHLAHASWDRRKRRGSLGDWTSSVPGSVFFRLLLEVGGGGCGVCCCCCCCCWSWRC